MRIMVVESDQDTSETLESIIEFIGFNAIFFQSAGQAIENLKQNQYDCIILDHYTCRKESLCEYFKQFESKIILMTSFQSAKNDFPGVRAECTLSKPFDIDTLEQTLRKCI